MTLRSESAVGATTHSSSNSTEEAQWTVSGVVQGLRPRSYAEGMFPAGSGSRCGTLWSAAFADVSLEAAYEASAAIRYVEVTARRTRPLWVVWVATVLLELLWFEHYKAHWAPYVLLGLLTILSVGLFVVQPLRGKHGRWALWVEMGLFGLESLLAMGAVFSLTNESMLSWKSNQWYMTSLLTLLVMLRGSAGMNVWAQWCVVSVLNVTVLFAVFMWAYSQYNPRYSIYGVLTNAAMVIVALHRCERAARHRFSALVIGEVAVVERHVEQQQLEQLVRKERSQTASCPR
jgi:hypothetical protein